MPEQVLAIGICCSWINPVKAELLVKKLGAGIFLIPWSFHSNNLLLEQLLHVLHFCEKGFRRMSGDLVLRQRAVAWQRKWGMWWKLSVTVKINNVTLYVYSSVLYRSIPRMINKVKKSKTATNWKNETVKGHTYKPSVLLCRARIPSSNRRQRPSRIPLTVENKKEQNSNGDKK